jgi:hypothetical protein
MSFLISHVAFRVALPPNQYGPLYGAQNRDPTIRFFSSAQEAEHYSRQENDEYQVYELEKYALVEANDPYYAFFGFFCFHPDDDGIVMATQWEVEVFLTIDDARRHFGWAASRSECAAVFEVNPENGSLVYRFPETTPPLYYKNWTGLQEVQLGQQQSSTTQDNGSGSEKEETCDESPYKRQRGGEEEQKERVVS